MSFLDLYTKDQAQDVRFQPNEGTSLPGYWDLHAQDGVRSRRRRALDRVSVAGELPMGGWQQSDQPPALFAYFVGYGPQFQIYGPRSKACRSLKRLGAFAKDA
jgi:hypothetical protein